MFLTNIKADSGDRSTWGGFWFSPVPMRSGIASVSGDNALQLSAVYACVRVLTDNIGTLPFEMYRRLPNGGRKQIKDHWLYRLIAKRPNDFQNPLEFREMMQGHLALRGNAFAHQISNYKGEVEQLIPIHPDLITIEMLSSTNWRFRVRMLDGSTKIFSRSEIFHIKGLSPDGVVGYSPIALARKMLATGIAAQDYGIRFFENDAAPSGGWIEHPGNFKDIESRRLWRESWQELQGGRNKGKTAVLEFGMKYHEPVAVSNSDSQFLETKKYSRSEIASMWRIPPHMIGDLERSTNNNIEHQSIEFITQSLLPWIVRWEEALKYAFLDPDDDDLCLSFPTMALSRGDMESRAEYINTSIMNGTLTPNEGRILEGRNPDPNPIMDKPLRMLNMVTVDDDETEVPPSKNKKVLPVDQNDDDDAAIDPKDGSASRLSKLATLAADRVARKEIEIVSKAIDSMDGRGLLSIVYSKHVNFVSQVIGVSDEVANQYCTEQSEAATKLDSANLGEFVAQTKNKLFNLAMKG